jgi:hypothetical protein
MVPIMVSTLAEKREREKETAHPLNTIRQRKEGRLSWWQ